MTKDENGRVWPETVKDEAVTKRTSEAADRFFERKAKREGWANNHKK